MDSSVPTLVHGSRWRQGWGTPKIGREFAHDLTADPAAALAGKVIAFYRENGKAPERLGATIGRVGFDSFVKAVI